MKIPHRPWLLLSVAILALFLFLPGVQASNETISVTVQLLDSQGNGLAGGQVSYYASGWKPFGVTDSNGAVTKELPPGVYSFRMGYAGATEQRSNVDIGVTNPLIFQTTEMVVQLQRCDGSGVAGGQVSYYASGWKPFGATDASGQARRELLPVKYSFRMALAGATEQRSNVDINAVNPLTFTAAQVTLHFSGDIRFYAGGWKSFSKPSMDLLPGAYPFRFDGHQQQLAVNGCSLEQSVLSISLKDSAGAGVEGGRAYLGLDSWPFIGTTDANGQLMYFHDGDLGSVSVRMDAPFYGGSQTSPAQDPSDNSYFGFQTVRAVIQLKDSQGNLVDGGTVQAGASGWPTIGATGDDGPGVLFHERFPGVFRYRVTFNGASAEQEHDVSDPFLFQTARAEIRLLDHNGDPLDGGLVRLDAGGWQVIGHTGDSGPGVLYRELFPGSYRFRMEYNYATEEKSSDLSAPLVFQTGLVDLQFSGSIQHAVNGWPAYLRPAELLPVPQRFGLTGCGYPRREITLTPTAGGVLAKSIVFAIFQDSQGNGLAGGAFQYRLDQGGYTDMGLSPGDGLILQMLDGLHDTVHFRVSYAGGTTPDRAQDIAADSCVRFHTVPVTARLLASDGSTVIDDGVRFEYRYGWGVKQPFVGPRELLPIETKLTVHYKGASLEQTQDAGVDPSFVFHTVPVTARLMASDGSAAIDDGVSFQFRYSVGAYQPFTSPMDLLPVTTTVQVQYKGASQEQTQDVGVEPDFVFGTVAVTASLLDHSGGDISGQAAFQFRYGWEDFQPFTSPMDLLPVTTKMRVSYAGGIMPEKSQDVGVRPVFSWQTGEVTSTTCTQYRYGWGPYHPFTSPMELLPLETKFSDGVNPDVVMTPVAGASTAVECSASGQDSVGGENGGDAGGDDQGASTIFLPLVTAER